MATVRPSIQPSSRNRCTKAAIRWLSVASVPKPKYPMVDNFAACWARAASGHAATAPPRAASNSRRPMVTVIRPSRARCVKQTIARHQRAVFTFKEHRMLPPFTGGHSQAREADCEPASWVCVTTTRRYCRACPRSWPQWLLLTKRWLVANAVSDDVDARAHNGFGIVEVVDVGSDPQAVLVRLVDHGRIDFRGDLGHHIGLTGRHLADRLTCIRCPAFSRVFPKNRCERAASGISPGTKKFFCKGVPHTKATPLWDGTIFGQVFVRGGMTKISKWKAPLPGGVNRAVATFWTD